MSSQSFQNDLKKQYPRDSADSYTDKVVFKGNKSHLKTLVRLLSNKPSTGYKTPATPNTAYEELKPISISNFRIPFKNIQSTKSKAKLIRNTSFKLLVTNNDS